MKLTKQVKQIIVLLVVLTIAVFCTETEEYTVTMAFDEQFIPDCNDIIFVEFNGSIIPVEVICE